MSTPDPVAGTAPASRHVALAGEAGPDSPPSGPAGKTSPAAAPQSPAAGDPSPAGGESASLRRAADSSSPAGSRGLRGAEWRREAARASRRRPTRVTASAAAKAAAVPPVTGGAALSATATCLGRCDWTAGPGDPGEVDKAARAHTEKPPKHPTNTVSVVAEIGGAA